MVQLNSLMNRFCGAIIVLSAVLACPLPTFAVASSTEKPNVVTDGAKQKVIVGILEEDAQSLAYPSGIKTTYFREVRVVFQKDDKVWKAFPSICPDPNCLKTIASQFPQSTTWTIAFHGRPLGQVTGRIKARFEYYSNIGWQDVISASPIPTIGHRSIDYGGFTGTPVFRPLVAISRPNYKDPDEWKSAALSPNLIRLARQYFRQKFPKAYNCKSPEENIERPWVYQNKDIKIAATYNSNKYWHLVQMSLTGYRCDAAIEDNNSPFLDQWFVISPSNEVRFLDSGMWLVDAGDYDNSGKSELMFCIDRYNRGGYELFYDCFEKHSVFQFGYH